MSWLHAHNVFWSNLLCYYTLVPLFVCLPFLGALLQVGSTWALSRTLMVSPCLTLWLLLIA